MESQLKQIETQEWTARKFGFYWENFTQILEQIQAESVEVREAWQKGDLSHLQEEIGDLMNAAVCLSVFFDFDPEETLQKSIEKFQKRYDKVVELANRDGHSHLHKQPFQLLIDYWNQAKRS